MDVVIFGTGEVADVAAWYIGHESEHRVVAFMLDPEYIKELRHLGLPVIPFGEDYLTKDERLFIAMSFKGVNAPRAAKVAEAKAQGCKPFSYFSPRAWAWDGFVCYPNTFVMEGNVIQPYTTIGEDCIVWSGNHIGHHTTIGDHCFIASHAVISGHVRIGDNTFIGVNATIRDNVTIGKRCVIGAGALVLHDVPDDSVVLGPESPVVPRRSTVA